MKGIKLFSWIKLSWIFFFCLGFLEGSCAFFVHPKAQQASSTRLSAVISYSGLPADEVEQIRAIGGPKADVYGEMTANGLRQAFPFTPEDSFLDLGSGYGALVLQAAREFGIPSMGMELSQERHALAMDALALEEPGVQELVTLLAGDAAGEEAGVLLNSATIVLCSNLLFNAELNQRLAQHMGRHGHKVRLVLSLREFPSGIPGFHLKQMKLPVEMSWTANKEQPGHPPMPGHGCSVYIRA